MNKKALLESIRESDLAVRDKVLLRMAVAFHRDKVEEAIEAAMEETDAPLNAVEGSAEWATLLKFFRENVLPILLQLLKK